MTQIAAEKQCTRPKLKKMDKKSRCKNIMSESLTKVKKKIAVYVQILNADY